MTFGSDYLSHVPLTRWLLERYDAHRSSDFPGGGKTAYDAILLATHTYLNENVHPTVQQRAPLIDEGVYLTDHGPRHIEVVLRRASQLVRSYKSLVDGENSEYVPGIGLYEIFLLTLGIHFHDVGNMYGRSGHETRLMDVMNNIGPLQPIDRFAKNAIIGIARSHGGRIEGDRDTIGRLAEKLSDGEVEYRPQLLAAVLRLADELADEHSRADNFGLISPEKLPETCLIFHKYAEGLQVSVDLRAGQIGLTFSLHAADCRRTYPKVVNGAQANLYLLDEIYERTLKTYIEMIYCGRFMRQLGTSLSKVVVSIVVYESPAHPEPATSLSFVIGESGYPDLNSKALRHLAKGYDLPDGKTFARSLGPAAARGRS